jgi:hypothetical protein
VSRSAAGNGDDELGAGAASSRADRWGTPRMCVVDWEPRAARCPWQVCVSQAGGGDGVTVQSRMMLGLKA